ncbi:MAG TPA: hypothetical protein VHG34_00560 [Nitrososphaeraceae archaeon]|nr:hypothetical protein [Nitrososphaeraceae archaeon]
MKVGFSNSGSSFLIIDQTIFPIASTPTPNDFFDALLRVDNLLPWSIQQQFQNVRLVANAFFNFYNQSIIHRLVKP